MKNLMKSSTRQLLRKTIACLTALLIFNGPVWAISETDALNKINANVGTAGNTTTVDVLGNRSIIDWSNFNTVNGVDDRLFCIGNSIKVRWFVLKKIGYSQKNRGYTRANKIESFHALFPFPFIIWQVLYTGSS